MNTQNGLELWGYHDNTEMLCFQKQVEREREREKKNIDE